MLNENQKSTVKYTQTSRLGEFASRKVMELCCSESPPVFTTCIMFQTPFSTTSASVNFARTVRSNFHSFTVCNLQITK